MKRLHKVFVTLIMIVSLMAMGTFAAFAAVANDSSLQSAEKEATEAGVSKDTVASELDGALEEYDKDTHATAGSFLVHSYNGKKYAIDTTDEDTYNNLVASINGLAGVAESEAEAANGTTDEVKKNIDTQIGGLIPEADLGGAKDALGTLSEPFALITGVLATLAIIGLTLFTACDVCYLSFPIAHEKMDSAGSSGGMMGGSTKDGGTKFRFVTDDAVIVYEETSKDGKSPWGAYLKRRALTFIFVSIIIYILLTGQITLIINIVLNIVSGVIEQIQEFAGKSFS